MGPQFDYCLRATNNPSYFAFPDKDVTDNAAHASHVSGPEQYSRSAPARAWADGGRPLQSPRRREPESPRRKEFRALLRSLSAKEPEKAEAFLKGQPRPGDCAPGDMRHTFTAPRIKKGKISATVVTSEGTKEHEEVFYTIPLPGRRRHSVGGYLTTGGNGSGEVTTVPSEVPKMPPPRFHQHDEEAVRRRRPKNFPFKEMEDIAILWSSGSPESALWSDYLVASFDKIMSQRARHHYRVTTLTAEELMAADSQEKLDKLAKSQLQIVILCPNLATKMPDLKRDLNCDELFKVDKVLVMLLGVEKNNVIAQNCDDYPTIDQWQMMSVREKDTSFVDTFLTAAVGILRTKDCKDTATDRTSFSIVPKKVKIGQSRVIALLNDPIREEDSIKIMVDKKGEVIQIPTFKKRNPYTLQFDIPESCLEVSMLVWVRVSKNGQSLGRRQIKCESRLRELDQLLRASDHPLEFMCQTLGFKTTSKEQLDSWMLTAFQKNIPPHFNLLSSTEQYNPKADVSSGEEYPTLLHWAARFGLERVCWQLLECPGGGAAVALRNARQRTPADLARDYKHYKLADMLADHLKINEFSNMYYYLKNMSDPDKEGNTDDGKQEELRIVESSDTVDSPTRESAAENGSSDPFSETCTQNLEDNVVKEEEDIMKKRRPSLKLPKVSEQLYQNDFQLRDNTADRIQQAIEHDYLVQPSNIKVESPQYRPNNLYVNSSRLIPQQSELCLYSPTEESKSFLIDTPTSDISQINLNTKDNRNSGNSVKSCKDATGQEELAEIINDFKNNVFTISEVEKLVMEWRNRNETQQSLKEKQEQLNKMREEYDKIQQKIKDHLKRPTPFERVKKMFSKSKNKHQENNTGTIEKRNGSTRPNSSLSESSSSSGRLSTVSGGSVGETNSMQSEHDDKARSIISSSTLTMNSACDGENRLDDYLIPPPPRPVNGCAQFTTFGHPKHDNRSTHMATIVERETSASRERLDESDATHLRMTFGSRRCDDRDGAHMYMNISATHT
ncbi:phosphoinositide 3-kinase adapter protein 1 isoform X1 [Colias croceus]|uniref:phosphoinositide 3-kinase adapter protein 1 isoform X1 n=1 Tax=Colias crocea TaxID=72248 RepID=UPI001E27CC12|nr:phosphoinositide 3-kinase adapter protein 1 isoform X1 [Colias croceus]XP_045495195.1 phosphoinositide 3-kinase adapter protein 1 isoform X1 [Colias croceus]